MSGILFHLAFPIHDIEAAKRFYVDGLGCTLGRESTHAVTFGLHDHQLVAHVVDQAPDEQKGIYPRHFGLVFVSKEPWQALADRAKAKGLTFYQQPRIRSFSKILPAICSNSNTTRTNRRFSASAMFVRWATPQPAIDVKTQRALLP
jgi:extradiol dioxygenase family protein